MRLHCRLRSIAARRIKSIPIRKVEDRFIFDKSARFAHQTADSATSLFGTQTMDDANVGPFRPCFARDQTTAEGLAGSMASDSKLTSLVRCFARDLGFVVGT